MELTLTILHSYLMDNPIKKMTKEFNNGYFYYYYKTNKQAIDENKKMNFGNKEN